MTFEVQAPSIMLIGDIGTGKTYSVGTLLAAGLEVFMIITEPTGLDTVLDVVAEKKLDINKLHWKVLSPSRSNWKSLKATSKTVGTMTAEGIAKMAPTSGRDKSEWMHLLDAMDNYHDDRTGKDFGDVCQFGSDRCVFIDSLSGLSLMAWDITVGDKVTANPGEWGAGMNLIHKFILSAVSGMKCLFVITGHLEPEKDEITGGTKLMASTLGAKLAPKLPRFFSEVVLAHRKGDQFFWSTTMTGVALKKRALPLKHELPPDFGPIVDAWRKRLAIAKAA